MWFINSIVSWLSSARDYFCDAYLEVRTWVYPFYYLSTPLYYLYNAFYYLAYYFSSFNDWIDWAATQLANIFSWETIKSLIKGWLPQLESAVDWFLNRLSWFTTQVTNWWNSTKTTVQGWISSAISGIRTLVDQTNTWLANLQEAWDSWASQLPNWNEVWGWFGNWWGNTLVNLGNWWTQRLTEVTSLLNTAFLEREPFWAGWQDVRDQVVEFITAPLQWFYDRLDDFFERFW